MTSLMPPPAASRKRPAPGTSPATQPLATQDDSLKAHSKSPQMGDDQSYLNWVPNASGNNTQPYTDPNSAYNPNIYNVANMGMGTSPQNPSGSVLPGLASTSTQLTTRKPPQQQLVPRGSRNITGSDEDTWTDVVDGMQVELHGDGTYEPDTEDLEQRAQVAKREAVAKRKQIPPFVQKLSSFLDQSRNTDLIRWSDAGDSFIVLDEDEFAKTLIPELFKHNNYASFVRQLNMYGFHKKVGLSDNSMRASERKNKSPSEYHNPYFRRGHPDLLWLINKPKNPNQNQSGLGHKKEQDRDGDDRSTPQPPGQVKDESADPDNKAGAGRRGTSAGGAKVVASNQELSAVQQQLLAIQQQQRVISGAINRLKKDHDQIYEQAAAFQTMHDRHESSINAILTFLATVYNRSLEGHGGQNFSNMFSNAIPHDPQGQRDVVDVGDYTSQGLDQMSRFRKQPLLLAAPPNGINDQGNRISALSPSTASPSPMPYSDPRVSGLQPQRQRPRETQTAGQAGAIEELFDPNTTSAAQSPQVKSEIESPAVIGDDGGYPQRDIMSMINSANASSQEGKHGRLDFPAALSHFQNADGNSPLTSKQRNAMLSMMAQDTNSAGSGVNNALMSPNPPQVPDLSQIKASREELDRLVRMQAQQNADVQKIASMVQPLSPSGSIPGLLDDQFYGGQGAEVPGALDLDQIFNSGDYFTSQGEGDNDLNFGLQNGLSDDINFDFNSTVPDANAPMNLGQENPTGQIVGTGESSEAASPETAANEGTQGGGKSPSRKRRRN